MSFWGEGREQEDFEEVSIETVHVGDYLCLPFAGSSPSEAACVLAKAPIRREPTLDMVGWQVEVAHHGPLWLPRRAKVSRRRFASSKNGQAARAALRPR